MSDEVASEGRISVEEELEATGGRLGEVLEGDDTLLSENLCEVSVSGMPEETRAGLTLMDFSPMPSTCRRTSGLSSHAFAVIERSLDGVVSDPHSTLGYSQFKGGSDTSVARLELKVNEAWQSRSSALRTCV